MELRLARLSIRRHLLFYLSETKPLLVARFRFVNFHFIQYIKYSYFLYSFVKKNDISVQTDAARLVGIDLFWKHHCKYYHCCLIYYHILTDGQKNEETLLETGVYTEQQCERHEATCRVSKGDVFSCVCMFFFPIFRTADR